MSDTVFYVWVTALSDTYSEPLVGRLVRQGWHVSSMGNQLSLHSEENLAAMISISVSRKPVDDKPENEITVKYVFEEIEAVLKRLGAHYYGIIVTVATACTWRLGNVTKTELKKLADESKKVIN